MPKKLQPNDTPQLNQLYFYLTEGCNLACRHCWLAPKFDPDGSEYASLPVELFETAIREAKPLGLNRVKLTGGEPLLHPHFTKLLEIVRCEEVGLTIETNGLLCTPTIVAEIAKSPQRFVAVSIDGVDAATHEWVRGVPGSFEKAKRAVRKLAAADTPPQIIMTLMRGNVDQVEAMIDMAEKLGASSLKLNVLQPTARAEKLHEADDALPVAEIIALNHRVLMELSTARNLRIVFDVPLAFRPLSRIANTGGCGVCGILGILGVIAKGQYALCGIGEHVPDLVFGEVGVHRLDQLWRNDVTLNLIRDGLPDELEGVCASCLMKHRCLGSCIAQNYYRSGSLWAPFWFCDQASASDMFPESRLTPHADSTN